MAQLRLLFALVAVLILSGSAYANCAEDLETLEAYYEASMNEDYEAYIALMDTEYIYEYLADERYYRYYVEAAWDVYDTIEYSLDIIKCDELPTGSVIFVEVDSRIEAEGETFDIERVYVAVFEQGKIQFVMDYETFAFHQNHAYALQYFEETQDIIERSLAQSEHLLEHYETAPTTTEPSQRSGWLWLVVVAALLGAVFVYRERLTTYVAQFDTDAFVATTKKKSAQAHTHLRVRTIPWCKRFIATSKEYATVFYRTRVLVFARFVRDKTVQLYEKLRARLQRT